MHRIALGVGRLFAMLAKPLVNALSWIPFNGLPWPVKTTGIFSDVGKASDIFFKLLSGLPYMARELIPRVLIKVKRFNATLFMSISKIVK
jgi:hypothetical protein